MQQQLSRRDALVRGALVLVGVGSAVHPGSAWAARRPTVGVAYRLEATNRCDCSACQRHAAHKLFATRAAADRGRAHPGCKCAIKKAAPLSKAQWEALFGSPKKLKHSSVDRRRASTKRALKRRPKRAVAAARRSA